MSVVIIGGNECMERKYKDICKSYECDVKTFIKPLKGSLKNKIGNPDLMIFFTGCMSHKMVHCALAEVKDSGTAVERAKSASASSLQQILEKYIKKR